MAWVGQGTAGSLCLPLVQSLTDVFFAMGIQLSRRAQSSADPGHELQDRTPEPAGVQPENRPEEREQRQGHASARRCPPWLIGCFGSTPQRRESANLPELAGSRYAGVKLRLLGPVDLREGTLFVGRRLTLGAPGDGTRESQHEFLTAISTDVGNLLASKDEDFEPAFKRFADNYRKILTMHGAAKVAENRKLLSGLHSVLNSYIADLESRMQQALSSTATYTPAPAGPGRPPAADSLPVRFDAVGTRRAFDIIEQAHAEKWGALEAEELASTGAAPLLEQAPEATGVVSRPAAEPDARAREAIRKEVAAMAVLNQGFRAWLDARNIEVVPSSGANLDCLLNATQQHATGHYDIRRFENGAWRRIVQEHGALHSDTEGVRQMVAAMNALLDTSIDLVVVSADEESRPRIISRTNTGDNPVVIWHQGDHYEALRYRPEWVADAERPGGQRHSESGSAEEP